MRKKKQVAFQSQHEQLSLFVDTALDRVEFLQTVRKIATGLEQETGIPWNVRMVPKDFTLQDRIRERMWEQHT